MRPASVTGSWVDSPRVPRCSAAHRVREIGPTTWSFGAASAPSQSHTFAVVGLAKRATSSPAVSVKTSSLPLVVPKNFVSGSCAKGTTVSFVVV